MPVTQIFVLIKKEILKMQIKIEMSYQTNSNPHFFQEKTTTSLVPACAKVFVLDGDGPNAINDALKESERAAVTTIIINNKTDFERASSAVLKKFVAHLKENYPNLKTIVGHNDESLNNLIIFNSLKENILQKEQKLVPQLLQRICASNCENKIQVLDQLNTFLQNATNEQLGQLENKISQLDQRQHYLSDLIKSIGSTVSGWIAGLGLIYEVTRKMTPATPFGWAFGLISIAAGSYFGHSYGVNFLNSGTEDIHHPENDKIAAIGTICSKI